jgi:hypothetical protein
MHALHQCAPAGPQQLLITLVNTPLLMSCSTAYRQDSLLHVEMYFHLNFPFLLTLCRCGTAALVSFTWGVLIEAGTVTQLPRALAGIAAILLGIAGVAAAGALQQAITAEQQQQQGASQQQPSTIAAAGSDTQQLQEPLLPDVEQNASPAAAAAAAGSRQHEAAQQQQQQQQRRIICGLLLAVTTGVSGGLILTPMDYIGRECRGLPYQAALAVGVAAAAVPVTYCLHWLHTRKVRVVCMPLVCMPVMHVLFTLPLTQSSPGTSPCLLTLCALGCCSACTSSHTTAAAALLLLLLCPVLRCVHLYR